MFHAITDSHGFFASRFDVEAACGQKVLVRRNVILWTGPEVSEDFEVLGNVAEIATTNMDLSWLKLRSSDVGPFTKWLNRKLAKILV